MLDGDPNLLSHGWTPEAGFIKTHWDTYSEDTILYLLAIGSTSHPIPASGWYKLGGERYRYGGFTWYTSTGVPLFMHQYSHAWVDYRNRREVKGHHIDYFRNSITATLAHRAFCMNLSSKFPGYSKDIWGITASDGPNGYMVWGGPPPDPQIDGTVVPSATGGSLMFTPELSVRALETMKSRFGAKIFGRYGFADSFNPTTGWVDSDVIGINVGITLLSAENARTGNVWRWVMRNHAVNVGLRRVGLLRKLSE